GGALRPRRHHRRDYAGAGPRPGRDNGGHNADRQQPRAEPIAVRAWCHRRVAGGQRTAEREWPAARERADLDRAGAVRHHAAAQPAGAIADLVGEPRAGRRYTRMSILSSAPPNYRRSKIADQLMRGLLVLATLAAIVPLIAIIGYVLAIGGS